MEASLLSGTANVSQADVRVSATTTKNTEPPVTDFASATVNEVVRRTGLSRTVVFRLLGAGQLRAVKSGTRTLVIWSSVIEYLASLPPATFGGQGGV